MDLIALVQGLIITKIYFCVISILRSTNFNHCPCTCMLLLASLGEDEAHTQDSGQGSINECLGAHKLKQVFSVLRSPEILIIAPSNNQWHCTPGAENRKQSTLLNCVHVWLRSANKFAGP